MIESLQINQFRNHAGTRFEFGRFTLLAGPNGVGKSNVLRCLTKFNFDGSFFDLQPPFSKPQHSSSLSVKGSAYVLELKLRGIPWIAVSDRSASGGFNQIHFRLRDRTEYRTYPRRLIFGGEDEDEYVDGTEISEWLAQDSFFYFKPELINLSSPHFSESPSPTLSSSGLGLASVLAYLMTSAPERFARIQAALKEIVPQVVRVRASREIVSVTEFQTVTVKSKEIAYPEEREVPGDALLFDMRNAESLSARDVSDGTLVVLALLTALYQEPQPRVLLLDDIETGLHPAAQECLMAQLRHLLEQIPDLQIVATTHSPFIIDQCDPNEVWLLSPDKDGMCHAARMSDHPQAEAALKVLTTGEFWSAEGEEWVVAKKPTKKASVKVAEP